MLVSSAAGILRAMLANPVHKDGRMMDVAMIAVCAAFFGITMAVVRLMDKG